MTIRRTAAALRAFGILAAAAALIAFSKSSREGVASGIEMCLGMLVPSLFPLMAVTNLMVRSGVCERMGKPLNGVTRAVFGVSGKLAPVIVTGLVGGYPVGAAGVSALYKQGAVSEDEARRAALFTVCAGPGFLVSFVGETVFGSAKAGWILYTAQAASIVLTGLLARLFYRGNGNNNSKIELSPRCPPFSQALVESVYYAARGMLSICAFVLLFSAVTGVLARVIQNQTSLSAAYVLCEVCTAVTKAPADCPMAVTAFAVGFGGLCVHFQIFAALGELRVSRLLFFVFRIIQGVITAALTELGLRLLPQKAAVFSSSQLGGTAFFGGSVLSGALLVGLMVCFMTAVKQTAGHE